ncbi:zincin-like metallopeptidase domain-containing protein [Labrys neptuniae]|uniref:ArdC family protein n=1 Tax=Labrys neptuniae TaxID=376174 RepID=UPI00288D9C72|nr:zincin-like metallopeptidase domain-containing protein [Labrys neptuniae]MDT3379630.1 zincin-like metallopeptidase domain-containing protein [Labrys neptuniae]
MSNSNETARRDVYSRITNQIIEALEQGVKPWTQPWNAAHAAGHVSRPLRHNGQPYAGINVLTLWASAMTAHYAAPIWMTFKQAIELGGHVRKGERGSPVVYANTISRTEADEATGDDTQRTIPFLKAYTVFNVEQVEGLPAHFYAQAEQVRNPVERIADAEAFFAATRADIRHGGDCAYYSPTLDYIQMPMFEAFRDAQSYYATLAHEATHWTRHATRLERDFGRKKFGDDGYAREELVAELGAAFLCADLGLRLEDRDDHASYIEHWLSVLKDDKRAVFAAAAHAQRAADYLAGFSRTQEAAA